MSKVDKTPYYHYVYYDRLGNDPHLPDWQQQYWANIKKEAINYYDGLNYSVTKDDLGKIASNLKILADREREKEVRMLQTLIPNAKIADIDLEGEKLIELFTDMVSIGGRFQELKRRLGIDKENKKSNALMDYEYRLTHAVANTHFPRILEKYQKSKRYRDDMDFWASLLKEKGSDDAFVSLAEERVKEFMFQAYKDALEEQIDNEDIGNEMRAGYKAMLKQQEEAQKEAEKLNKKWSSVLGSGAFVETGFRKRFREVYDVMSKKQRLHRKTLDKQIKGAFTVSDPKTKKISSQKVGFVEEALNTITTYAAIELNKGAKNLFSDINVSVTTDVGNTRKGDQFAFFTKNKETLSHFEYETKLMGEKFAKSMTDARIYSQEYLDQMAKLSSADDYLMIENQKSSSLGKGINLSGGAEKINEDLGRLINASPADYQRIYGFLRNTQDGAIMNDDNRIEDILKGVVSNIASILFDDYIMDLERYNRDNVIYVFRLSHNVIPLSVFLDELSKAIEKTKVKFNDKTYTARNAFAGARLVRGQIHYPITEPPGEEEDRWETQVSEAAKEVKIHLEIFRNFREIFS